MIINIEDLENSKDNTINVDYEKENEELDSKNLLRAILTIKKISDTIVISGNITGWVEKVCDRCLKNFKYIVDIDVEETYSLKPLFDYSCKEIKLEDGQFDEELIDTDKIDLDNFIYQSVTLNFPNKIVCDINCNMETEQMKKYVKEFVQDPRLEIFNKLKKDK